MDRLLAGRAAAQFPAAAADGAGANLGAAPQPGQPDVNLGLNEADYDEGLLAVIKTLARRVEWLERQAAQEHERTWTQQFDDAIASLGPSWEPIFGKGRVHELKQDTPEFMQRQALAQRTVAAVQRGAAIDATVFKLADAGWGHIHNAIKGKSAAKAAPTPDEEAWTQGGLLAPTHRSGAAEPKGREAAIKAVQNHDYFRQRAAPPAAPDVADEFPQ